MISCAHLERSKSYMESEGSRGKMQNNERLSLQNIPGEYLRAFLSAHEAFLEDKEISAQHKTIQNYEVMITEESNMFKVYFSPKMKPGEKEMLGGRSELGRHVYYLVDPKDFKVVTRKFMK
jgi:hypothetical protein